MNDEEKNEVESVKKWIGRWLVDMSSKLMRLNSIPPVRKELSGGKNDVRRTRVMPDEPANSKEVRVPIEMVNFLRKRYGNDVVVYLRDKAPKTNGEGIVYLVKLLEDDGSKQGRPVGIAEISSEVRRDSGGKVTWYVRESKQARDRWKERYQELFVAQYGEKALAEFLNRD